MDFGEFHDRLVARGYSDDTATTHVRRKRRIPQDLMDITGVISLPPDKSDSDLVRDVVLEKYGNPVLKFCGVLSKDDADRMSAVVAEQRTIDEDMWK